MKSRAWWIIAAVLLLIPIGIFIWWQSSSSAPVKKEAAQRLTPKVSLASMNISDIDDERIKLNSTIQLSNPLPVDLHIKELRYELFIDSIRVMQDAYGKPITIHSSDSTTIQMPMELLTKPMARVLRHFEATKADSADYTMKATFDVDVPVAGKRNFSMDVSKRLPAVRLPKVKVRDVDLNALQLKKKGVDMVVTVTNPNTFPIKLKDGRFSFAMEDDLKMQGTLEKVINIPAGGSEDVTMHANVTDGSMLKAGWKMLTDKKDTRFTYNFRCKLLTESGLLRNSTMATSVQGTLAELANAVKKAK
jgi:LEA14-like dessication related protein